MPADCVYTGVNHRHPILYTRFGSSNNEPCCFMRQYLPHIWITWSLCTTQDIVYSQVGKMQQFLLVALGYQFKHNEYTEAMNIAEHSSSLALDSYNIVRHPTKDKNRCGGTSIFFIPRIPYLTIWSEIWVCNATSGKTHPNLIRNMTSPPFSGLGNFVERKRNVTVPFIVPP